MTYGSLPGREPRSGGREAAREHARELRERYRKRDRRRRAIVVSSIVGGVVAIAAIVTLVLANVDHSLTRGPLNMASDGIKIGQDYKADITPGLAMTAAPTPAETNAPGVIDIRIYVDYLCPNCGSFEQVNGDQLRAWIESGAATVEIHPLAVLTTKSAGTQYSLRAANAAACVAEYSPDHFFDFNDELFRDQPAEGSAGLDDDELVRRAEAAGVDALPNIRVCIRDGKFRDWVLAATDRALAGPVPDSDVSAIASTPTVIVNGKEFKYTDATDPKAFAQFVQLAAGATFASNATPAPTPAATPAG